MASPRDTALARLEAVGARDLDATIAARPHPVSLRELPRISVDLHATLAARKQPGAPTRPERDLEVLASLGEGGMGRVLLARQHSLDREVAIKTLHADASEREREALIAEGAITGHLEHPAIVPVHALGLDADGRPVLVMKRVEGEPWSRLLDGGDAPLDRHLEILIQVCHAVELAHSRRIVHRDIKPQNVMIGRYGEVYLCDWGLALRIDRPWQPQPLCGTPGYMAPEMVLGEPVDERTDVYLLGATLHFVLTGRPRNDGEDVRVASLAALDGAPFSYPPSVPAELAALANRATAREPAERLASVRALREALIAFRQHGSAAALSRAAAERVAAMRDLIDAGLRDEEAQRRFDRLAVEARFALDEARVRWPDDPDAAGADAALEALLAQRRSRAAELERLARDLDPDALGRHRVVVQLGIAVIGVILSINGLVAYPDLPSPRALLLQSTAPLGLLVILLIALRRRAFATVFNRRLSLTGLALIGGITASRVLAIEHGTTAPAMLLQDSTFLAIGLFLASLHLFRWMAWSALLLGGAAIAIAASPSHAGLAFSLATGVALVSGAWQGLRN